MNRTRTFRRGAAVAVLLMLAGAGSASAYVIPDCSGHPQVWSNPNPNFTAILDFPSGSAGWRTALDSAFDAWNLDAPGSRFDFNRTWILSAPDWSSGDGVNSVLFPISHYWGTGVLAETRIRYEICWPFIGGGAIVETDVLFNRGRTWRLELNPPVPPGPFDPSFYLKQVAIHEFGHALGLMHDDDIVATMNSIYPLGGSIGGGNDLHPHADDVLGNRVAYGVLATERDLAVSAYQITSFWDTDHWVWFSDLITPPASSPRGHKAGYRFTVENRGTTDEGAVRVEFYLSTDRTITTADTLLGAVTYAMGSGADFTSTASVTIPTSVAPGNYFVGYVIDPQGAVAEVNEGNNAVSYNAVTNVPPTSPPLACFTMNPTSGLVGQSIGFNGSCTSDPDGHAIVGYQWNFGDGKTGSGASVSHKYSSAGTYTVRLTVTDSTGATNSTTQSLFIEGGGSPCPSCSPL